MKASRHPSGKRAMARSRSIRGIGVSRGPAGSNRRSSSSVSVSFLILACRLRTKSRQWVSASRYSQGPLAREAPKLAVRLEKDLLHEIFALVRRAGHARRQGEDARGVLMVQRLEGVDLACLAPCHELGIAHRRSLRRERRALGLPASASGSARG